MQPVSNGDMIMTAITISRQLGSLGDEVGQAVAGRLNFGLVSREVINQAASRAHAPEVALATIDDLGLLDIRPSQKDRRAYQQAVKKVMQELAEAGKIVIIGRAGQVILKDHPNVLHVKVIAPAELRAERLALQQEISIESARAQIEASDNARRNYLRRYYRVRWDQLSPKGVIESEPKLWVKFEKKSICERFSQCVQVEQ